MPAIQMHNKQSFDAGSAFGGNFQRSSATEESDIIINQLHCRIVRSNELHLVSYSGGVDTNLRTLYLAGCKTIHNIHWGQGNQPRPFVTDLTAYRNQLTEYLDLNGRYIYMMVVENEADNAGFYAVTMSTVDDYLTQVEITTQECKRRNIKITDSGTHMAYYGQIRNGGQLSGQTAIGNAMLVGFRSINMDYVNTHWNVPSNLSANNTTMNVGMIKSLGDWCEIYTGHPIMTNEWHQRPPGTDADHETMCRSLNTEIRRAHLPYNMVYSGDPDVQVASNGALQFITSNGVLNSLGIAYRDSIASGV